MSIDLLPLYLESSEELNFLGMRGSPLQIGQLSLLSLQAARGMTYSITDLRLID